MGARAPKVFVMFVSQIKGLAGFGALGIAAVLWVSTLTCESAPVNAIQGVVHDSVVTQFEVQQLTAPALPRLRSEYAGQEQAFFRKLSEIDRENLEQLMQRQLILHDFKTSGFNLPESILDDLVAEQIKSRYTDRRTLTKSLQADGITYEKFRERLRERFIIEAMRNKYISSEIIISPQKVENYYQAHKEDYKVEDAVKLRMIVLSKPGDPASGDSKKLAQELLVKIKEGTPFSELAVVYSQRSQRDKAGEWYEKSQLRKELAEATAKLKSGDISEVVETTDAYYLLQVEELRPEHYKPLSEMRTSIENSLVLQERARLEKQWVERLKKKTFIRYY
jgi:peptidyl-prolyl cis-trans isomerase SurA